jgi:hypothetical protein
MAAEQILESVAMRQPMQHQRAPYTCLLAQCANVRGCRIDRTVLPPQRCCAASVGSRAQGFLRVRLEDPQSVRLALSLAVTVHSSPGCARERYMAQTGRHVDPSAKS